MSGFTVADLFIVFTVLFHYFCVGVMVVIYLNGYSGWSDSENYTPWGIAIIVVRWKDWKLLVWENVTWDFWGYIFMGDMWVLGGEWGVYCGFGCWFGFRNRVIFCGEMRIFREVCSIIFSDEWGGMTIHFYPCIRSFFGEK